MRQRLFTLSKDGEVLLDDATPEEINHYLAVECIHRQNVDVVEIKPPDDQDDDELQGN